MNWAYRRLSSGAHMIACGFGYLPSAVEKAYSTHGLNFVLGATRCERISGRYLYPASKSSKSNYGREVWDEEGVKIPAEVWYAFEGKKVVNVRWR